MSNVIHCRVGIPEHKNGRVFKVKKMNGIFNFDTKVFTPYNTLFGYKCQYHSVDHFVESLIKVLTTEV